MTTLRAAGFSQALAGCCLLSACGGLFPSSTTLTVDAGNAQATVADGVQADGKGLLPDGAAVPQPITKLDVLWVFDHSPGSCQEETAFGDAFPTFVERLRQGGIDDVQVAVIAAQQVADRSPDGPVQQVGGFLHTASKSHPPNCIERVLMPCTQDSHCAGSADKTATPRTQKTPAFGPGMASLCPPGGNLTVKNPQPGLDWRCKTTSKPEHVVNDNAKS